MKVYLVILLISISIFGCKSDDKELSPQQSPQMMGQGMNPQTSSSGISITDETLAEIDPAIKSYSEKLNSLLKNYVSDKSLKNKSELIESYIRYADYMQYESPVSPMKGKYRKALSLYRKALELNSGNSKVMAEITQIEDIYKSMGRPIPSD
ncbi:MAG: hypothetical protein KJ666_09325 [Bacteroidetes bacterium]|nr:hypothetical protein [Bacteroidota bacterium]MBU2585669.1 hypothetical protein [Bacteroidota bacterium]